MRSSDASHKSEAYRLGSATLVGAAAVILAALAFEYVGGYAPCALCLQQRWAYYAAIPALFVALIVLSSGKPAAGGVIFLLVSIGFLVNAGLGTYHAGAEWGFWPGPDTCAVTSRPLPKAGGGILNQLKDLKGVARCDEAAIRILGLSLAGWNVIASILLWITSQAAAFATTRLAKPA